MNYRVVGVGFEIRNLLPPTTATGRIIVAPIPVTGRHPGINALTSYPSPGASVIALMTGTGPLGGWSTDILELPDAVELTVQDVIAQTLSLNAQPITPRAFEFITANNIISSNTTPSQWEGLGTITVATGVTATNDNLSLTAGGIGWDGFAMLMTGLPVSVVNALEIKYIYHLEGTPVIQSGAGALVPAVTPKTHVNPTGHMSVLSKTLNQPCIKIASKVMESGVKGFMSGGPTGAANGAMRTLIAKLGLQL